MDDDSINRIADELNRQSDGMDLPMVPTPRVAAIARPVAVEPVDVVDKLFAENQVWAAPADEPVASDVVDTLFVENRVWSEPADEAVASDAVDRLFAENRVWSEPADEVIASDVTPAPAPQPSFEPIEVVEGDSSVADELNRESEGLALAGERGTDPRVGTPPHPRRRDGLAERPDEHHDAVAGRSLSIPDDIPMQCHDRGRAPGDSPLGSCGIRPRSCGAKSESRGAW